VSGKLHPALQFEISNMSVVETVGQATIDGLAYLGDLTILTGRSLHAVIVGPFQGQRPRGQRAVHQAMAAGVGAIPILSLISFFIGVIMALQSAYELKKLGAIALVARAVAIAITRELAPLITAIVVIGRSGSAFAAEIGSMKVNEELDALETMALDPVEFLVAPKLVAMALMLPCLTTWADFMGIIGGATFGIGVAGFTLGSYIRATLHSLVFRDIITGLIKSVMFGVVITAVGCQEGLSTGLGAEQVGRTTTSAVVKSIFMVVAVDLVFTLLFYFTTSR
jgi:phospholipid/cholesterol/gamma-HCH transport system permease protein